MVHLRRLRKGVDAPVGNAGLWLIRIFLYIQDSLCVKLNFSILSGRTLEQRSNLREIKYAAPNSLADALSLLQEMGTGAKILAGGTDLILQFQSNAPSAVFPPEQEVEAYVDGKRIPELMEL